jgi:hypothetical protein
MTRPPDKHDDVIVYEFRGIWEIWLGDKLHGVRFTRESAFERASVVAAAHRKPSWLLGETGYPLTPIETRTTLTQTMTPAGSA